MNKKLQAMEAPIMAGMEEYKQALKDKTFENKEDEPEGTGESRKTAMQKKLTDMVDKAEKLKAKIDSREPISQLLDPESIKDELTPFLEQTWKLWSIDDEKIKNAVIQPIVIDPTTEDYQTRQTDTDTSKFGEFTVNPDTQDLDFENIPEAKVFIPDLSSLNGRPLSEVADYIIANFSNHYKIPGIEYWKFILENPDKAPAKLKDGNYYFEFGSLVRGSGGRWSVPGVRWGGSDWGRYTSWLGDVWSSSYRVVLLEI
ncbi:MAG: hypothetical protein EHM20_15415 [Alphaproteobacteria bacterium]|nr:MAG: hypothetical protein EHM20_15415 [Alphaproteobacteria bacterium]